MKKTSLTDPLQINEVAVPGVPGRIGMTLCPGKVLRSCMSGDWHRDLDLDLEAIRAWGATALVTLMEPEELVAFQVAELPRRLPEGMAHHVLPIRDGGVPAQAWERAWEASGPVLREALRKGERILIHCRGGLGRTGLLAARLLVEFGMDPDQAMAEVRRARPGAIENAAQERYVRRQKPLSGGPCRPDLAGQFQGCLLGGGVGDALGAPVEFMSLPEIRRTFGPGGIRDMAPAYGRAGGAITDDTQMTLFTAEGLLRAHAGGLASVPAMVGHAYQRWLRTQGIKGHARNVREDGWLFTHSALFDTRAPGNTCVSALAAVVDPAAAVPARNDSKGCGGVMRVAPVGLYAAALGLPPGQAFTWGCEVSALTHGHPTGQLPGGVLAMVLCELIQGTALREAIHHAERLLKEQPAHGETLGAIQNAERLADSGLPAEAALTVLGQGWVAEEALAIALFCALRAGSFEEGVLMAANLTGDSDSTAAITGNLLGAMLGVQAIPGPWLEALELKEVITTMADDLASVATPGTPDREPSPWRERYPGW